MQLLTIINSIDRLSLTRRRDHGSNGRPMPALARLTKPANAGESNASLEPPVSDPAAARSHVFRQRWSRRLSRAPPPTSSRLCFWLSGLSQIASRKTGRVAPGPGPGPANHGYSYCAAYWSPGAPGVTLRCGSEVRAMGTIRPYYRDIDTHTMQRQKKCFSGPRAAWYRRPRFWDRPIEDSLDGTRKCGGDRHEGNAT